MWTEAPNDGAIKFTQETISLESNKNSINSFPYLYLNDNSIFGEILPIEIEIRFRYTELGDFGGGIFISDGIVLSKSERREKALFQVWQDAANYKLSLISHLCHENEPGCDERSVFYTADDYNTESHVLKVVYSADNKYRAYLDDFGQPLFISSQTYRFPKGLDFGNVSTTESQNLWSDIEVDYVRINETPSNELTPVLIIPGLGASWNYNAILNNTESSNWFLPEWINVYDNLINTFEDAGYTKNEDLFVYTYDWRKKLNELGIDLNNYLNNLVNSGKVKDDEKINVIGHSYGGLVGRSYLHQFGSDTASKLITLGSPHEGSALSYGAWEGAQLWGRPWWQKVALEVLLELNRAPGETKVEAIQRMSPSLKDLLPVYQDYLYDTQAEGWKDVASLYQQNLTLHNWKGRVGDVDNKITALGGVNKQTLETIDVVERNWINRALDQWEDGKPKNLNYSSQGDGVVLALSAFSSLGNFSTIESDHVDLVSNNQGLDMILETIGLGPQAINSSSVDKSEEVLIVLLESPGKLRLIDSQGKVLDENTSEFDGYVVSDPKMIIVPSPSLGNYRIKIIEEGEVGQYHLHVGILKSLNTEWLSFMGNLKSSEVDQFNIELDEGGIEAASSAAYDYKEVIDELLVQIDSLMNSWQERNGQRAEIFYASAKNNIRSAYEEADDDEVLLLLNRSRYLLNQLSRQAESSEKYQVAEITEELLSKIDDWSYQFGESEESETEKIKLVLERVINYKENELSINYDKNKALSFIKASLLKEKGDDLFINQEWGQARETYLSAWFWLIKS